MRAALLAALLVAASAARAAEVNGYLDSRSQFTRARVLGLLPTEDLPQLDQLVEGNVQVKQGYAPGGAVFGDLSLFGRAAGNYRSVDDSGREVVVPDHDVEANHPFASINELYLGHDVLPELNLLAGKKRIVWGSGLAYNPTDLLNPSKDPTDPSLQRAGAWMARVEVPLATGDDAFIQSPTFTLLFSPQVLKQANGIPYRFLTYPSWDRQDDQAHWILAARAYGLVANADINLMAFYGNRYRDAFERKLRLGASFSRYFFDDYELHVEALVQQGSARSYPRGECLTDRLSAIRCVVDGTPIFETRRLEDRALLPRVLVGTRYQFPDETLVSVEYLYQADGYSRSELQELVNGAALAREARRLGLPGGGTPFARAGEQGAPQRFTFEPLGRHYVFLTFQKPKIRDDFTAQAVVIASLQDLSGLISPSVSWAAREWLTLSLAGFLPFPGPDDLASTIPETTERVSEYMLLPLEYRAILQVRAFF